MPAGGTTLSGSSSVDELLGLEVGLASDPPAIPPPATPQEHGARLDAAEVLRWVGRIARDAQPVNAGRAATTPACAPAGAAAGAVTGGGSSKVLVTVTGPRRPHRAVTRAAGAGR